jgi:hypothetical protein
MTVNHGIGLNIDGVPDRVVVFSDDSTVFFSSGGNAASYQG